MKRSNFKMLAASAIVASSLGLGMNVANAASSSISCKIGALSDVVTIKVPCIKMAFVPLDAGVPASGIVDMVKSSVAQGIKHFAVANLSVLQDAALAQNVASILPKGRVLFFEGLSVTTQAEVGNLVTLATGRAGGIGFENVSFAPNLDLSALKMIQPSILYIGKISMTPQQAESFVRPITQTRDLFLQIGDQQKLDLVYAKGLRNSKDLQAIHLMLFGTNASTSPAIYAVKTVLNAKTPSNPLNELVLNFRSGKHVVNPTFFKDTLASGQLKVLGLVGISHDPARYRSGGFDVIGISVAQKGDAVLYGRQANLDDFVSR
jgi:hypothetical protein